MVCSEREIKFSPPSIWRWPRYLYSGKGADVAGQRLSKALGGWFDIVVAMYHDQGHIPLKVKGFVYDRDADRWQAVAGVNVTLGPIIRASVDHGTGFGHAGTAARTH